MENLNEVYRLIDDSCLEPLDPMPILNDPTMPICRVMATHKHLDRIFDLLWNGDIMRRGSFCDHVFRLIFFHQSLIGLEEHPAVTESCKEERLLYCDEEFL